VEFEPMDDFEQELRQGMLRMPAPPSLKQKILARRKRQNTQRVHARLVMWQRLATSIVLAAVAGGAYVWHNIEERRKGEEAKQQVLTALRITSRALQQMNQQLAEHNNRAE
jgi:transcriptional/translational regulatory protein YebC/TACO1